MRRRTWRFMRLRLAGMGRRLSCVGDDELGREIRHRLHDEGLDEKAVAVDAAHPTGMVTVDLDEGG